MEAIHLFSPPPYINITLSSLPGPRHLPHPPTHPLYCHANPVTTLLMSLSRATVSFSIRFQNGTASVYVQARCTKVKHAHRKFRVQTFEFSTPFFKQITFLKISRRINTRNCFSGFHPFILRSTRDNGGMYDLRNVGQLIHFRVSHRQRKSSFFFFFFF